MLDWTMLDWAMQNKDRRASAGLFVYCAKPRTFRAGALTSGLPAATQRTV